MVAAAVAWPAEREVRVPEVRRSSVGEVEARAAAWNLSAQDVRRYDEIMAGPRGHWSPGADPLLVLGAHARTPADRRRFAEAFVRAEHVRVEGELAFEREIQAAWSRLFPGRPRLAGAPGPLPSFARYAVVVRRACAEGCRVLRKYLGASIPLDVYVVGAADDADLRAWVGEQAIEPAAIAAGRVTVNHGDGGAGEAVPSAWGRSASRRWSRIE